ncbi:hypothetical protein ACPPVU_00395 [Mucilaginibacter sp. McL0603]|uniref:hypothetical protein n=1 Tax=Mucilaginibacter sp. McL0603 TaxID=3415670 RepID=UPI003CF82FA9
MKALKYFLIPVIVILICSGFANVTDNVEDSHARAIRLALEAGGLNTKGYPLLSKNYGPFLSKLGFSLITPANYLPQKGDIRVFQPYPGGEPVGHVDMYDGRQWVSDFKEANFWPSAKYKKYHPSYQIFRWLRK